MKVIKEERVAAIYAVATSLASSINQKDIPVK